MDEGDQLTRTALQKGLSSIRLPDTTIRMKEVLMNQNASECDVCQLLLPDIHTLIDTTESGFMQTFARKSGIPTVRTSFGLTPGQRAWPGLTAEESEWLIQVNPPEDTISTIVPDLVTEYGIRNAVLFYDKSFGEIERGNK